MIFLKKVIFTSIDLTAFIAPFVGGEPPRTAKLVDDDREDVELPLVGCGVELPLLVCGVEPLLLVCGVEPLLLGCGVEPLLLGCGVEPLLVGCEVDGGRVIVLDEGTATLGEDVELTLVGCVGESPEAAFDGIATLGLAHNPDKPGLFAYANTSAS